MTDVAVIEARHQPVLRRDIVTDREWPFCSCGHRDCETRQALDALRAAEAREARLRDRDRIARFLHTEMFDATPEQSLDLDATALDMADRLLALLAEPEAERP